MPKKQYLVHLTEAERDHLLAITGEGQTKGRIYKRARVLLLADEDKTDSEIAKTVGVGQATVERVRTRFVLEGAEAALNERPRPGASLTLNPQGEAAVVTLAQSEPPPGRTRWTLESLAEKLVDLQVVSSISGETVRRVLKEAAYSLYRKKAGEGVSSESLAPQEESAPHAGNEESLTEKFFRLSPEERKKVWRRILEDRVYREVVSQMFPQEIKKLEEVEEKLEEVEQKLSSAVARIKSLEEENLDLKEKAQFLKTKLATERSQRSQSEDRLQELELATEEWKKKKARKEKEFEELRERLAKLASLEKVMMAAQVMEVIDGSVSVAAVVNCNLLRSACAFLDGRDRKKAGEEYAKALGELSKSIRTLKEALGKSQVQPAPARPISKKTP